MKYAVMYYNNYNYDDSEIRVFDTEQEASEFLKKDWEECYNEGLKGEGVVEGLSYMEDDFAKIEWEGADIQFWQLVPVVNTKG